jgi:hypothetical protein
MTKHPRQSTSVAVPETSSRRVGIPREQQALFREVLALLEKKSVAFAVAGAFALQEHTGIFRDTKDLDLFLTPANAVIALRSLREWGFSCEVCDPVWLYKAHRNHFYVDLITGMSNAAFTVEDSWIAHAQPGLVCGVRTRVLAPEELLVSKLFVTRRERFDGADIAHVIYGTRGKLDWDRVLHMAGEHWEILFWALVLYRYVYPAQTDYVPRNVWQDLIGRFQKAVFEAENGMHFRGSLIDEKMFAIDVKEWGLENLHADYRARRLRSVEAA